MKKLLAVASVFLFWQGAAYAGGAVSDPPSNVGPPIGSTIGSLTGLAISGTYNTATYSFTAGATATNITFAIREDPAFLDLTDVSVTDVTTPGPNLIGNGSFAVGTVGTQTAPPWNYLNGFGASFGGQVQTNAPPDLCLAAATCWYDGAVQAYDAINQIIPTAIGDSYDVSFEYADTAPGGTYQPLSTNGNVTDTGGNGRDMFVYAGAEIPVTSEVPEPASLVLLGSGMLGLAAFRRRRAKT